MNYKEKGWLWRAVGQGQTYTTINHTLYYPKGSKPWLSQGILKHEGIHERQQQEVGLVKYIFLYLFCCPILWNPWRWKWEYEAYRDGMGWRDDLIRMELRSRIYGWLRFH